MSSGHPGTKGAVVNITLPLEVEARITRAAAARYASRNEYIRRFLIDNLDVIAPVGEE